MALGGAVMIVFALGIALFARTIAELYLPATPDTAEAVALTVRFLHVAAAFQLFDGIQVIGANALRGLKDARLPMLLAGGAYWLVGLPLALVLGFGLHWHGVGIWLGLACSLAVAAVSSLEPTTNGFLKRTPQKSMERSAMASPHEVSFTGRRALVRQPPRRGPSGP